ncbi:phenoloxidase-activating factor 2 [Aedes albopictus]|uniref:Peptidase S1 domain-containing protein n=1 Tax=Aedes albopictus TaxID=7160 RepID=A0ABM1Z459_AEDAL|nr:phenoloxidase-activating factor 2-like [Aedes albopictus]XP_029713333.1 phenoloxidase-activating factor 2-like [Aedes albopictus]
MKRLVVLLALLLLSVIQSSHGQTCTCVKKDQCKTPDSLDVTVFPKNSTQPVGLDPVSFDLRVSTNDGCDLLETCCEEKDIVVSTQRSEVTFDRCGVRHPNGIGYRLTGEKSGSAQYGEFPWTLMILKYSDLLGLSKEVYLCAASLIAPDLALTTAHCVNNSDQYYVRAGEWDTSSIRELYPTQTQKVVQIVVHENYNIYHHNNIALLKLEKPFEADHNVQIVCLPPQRSFDGSECFTGAWGKDKFEQGVQQNILRSIEVPVMPHSQCQAAFRNTRLGPSFILHDSYMCAGGEENVDACTGDGGAPLVCPADGSRYYQVGIVAWGIGCGQRGVPGAYTDVTKFMGWIRLKMFELGSSLEYSTF